MATTTARSGRDEEPYSLDHVLSSTGMYFSSIFEQKFHSFFTEFETSQHEQAIQNELDKIQGTHINGSNHLTSPTSLAVAAYEREVEEKEREIEDFERVVADVGSRKEKVQRQLQLNRDNIER